MSEYTFGSRLAQTEANVTAWDTDVFNARVAQAKSEILEDIASGRVPADVADFSTLHDYVDANEYGGLCDDEIQTASGYMDSDTWLWFGVEVQDAVDQWLKQGRPE